MLTGAFLITFMIIWMLEQKHIAAELHKKIDKEIDEKHKAGLFGYNGNPSLLEVISYILYILIVSILISRKRYNKQDSKSP